MAVGPFPPVGSIAAPHEGESHRFAFESVWRAPLVPAALAMTAGIVLDRCFVIPLPVSLLAATASLAAWLLTRNSRQSGLALLYLALAGAALAAAYHQAYRDWQPPDDVGRCLTEELVPVQVRGRLEKGPFPVRHSDPTPLQSFPASASSVAIVQATAFRKGDAWLPVSGRLRLEIADHPAGLAVGDELEIVGRASAPRGPMNPGEFDYAAYLQDQQVRGVVRAQKTADALHKIADGWPGSPARVLSMVYGWCRRALEANLSAKYHGLAIALLLGEGAPLTVEEKDEFVRTAVIHVLVISGQHLVLLSMILWKFLGLFGVSRRWGALLVSGFLLAYALLTGGQPPAMRSAIMALAGCGALVLRRPVMPANLFALAWLGVAALDPTDVFNIGCQLSFLCVFVLCWGVARWVPPEADPLDRLVEATRPAWRRGLRAGARLVAWHYAVTLVLWLAVTPLAAARNHVISPAGLVIGPPIVSSRITVRSGRMVTSPRENTPCIRPALP
jgi:competence protein ComEC